MMKKELYNSVLLYVKDLDKYAGTIGKDYSENAVHELRTSFKKLRALLRWQKISGKTWQPFKKTYAMAGELRNIQVALGLLQKEKQIPRSFRTWLLTILADARKEWTKVDHKRLILLLKTNIEGTQLKFTKHRRFFSGHQHTIYKLLNTLPVADNTLHDIRKMIKDMQYILAWWQEKNTDAGDLIKTLPISKLKHSGQQIGDHNDSRLFLDLLTRYVQQEKDPVFMNKFRALTDKCQNRKALKKEKLLIALTKTLLPS